jgi:hypothetical protein
LFRFQGDNYEPGAIEWFPGFIPDGFETAEIIEFYIGRHIFFERADGSYIVFEYSPASDTIIGVDNEYTEMEAVLLNGIEYFVITPLPGKEQPSQILWRMSGYAFHLHSMLDSEILFEMSVSVTSTSG